MNRNEMTPRERLVRKAMEYGLATVIGVALAAVMAGCIPQ